MLNTRELNDLDIERHLKFDYALQIDSYINRLYIVKSKVIKIYELDVNLLESIVKDFDILEEKLNAD